MIDLEQITLENGITYSIIKEIDNYVYLINPQNENDFCIRKNVVRDGEEYLESLKDENEFKYALSILKNTEKND